MPGDDDKFAVLVCLGEVVHAFDERELAGLIEGYALMSSLSPTIIWHQALLWGGNVIYVGVLAGWAVADAFR